jgi:hypothetical protein
MFALILSLVACSPTNDNGDVTSEITTMQHISIQELDVAFEDRNGIIQAPAGDILSASMCYEQDNILMCSPTSWGIDDQGYIHMNLNVDTDGVIKYVNITEE